MRKRLIRRELSGKLLQKSDRRVCVYPHPGGVQRVVGYAHEFARVAGTSVRKKRVASGPDRVGAGWWRVARRERDRAYTPVVFARGWNELIAKGLRHVFDARVSQRGWSRFKRQDLEQKPLGPWNWVLVCMRSGKRRLRGTGTLVAGRNPIAGDSSAADPAGWVERDMIYASAGYEGVKSGKGTDFWWYFLGRFVIAPMISSGRDNFQKGVVRDRFSRRLLQGMQP